MLSGNTYTIRLATAGDGAALRRLAASGSQASLTAGGGLTPMSRMMVRPCGCAARQALRYSLLRWRLPERSPRGLTFRRRREGEVDILSLGLPSSYRLVRASCVFGPSPISYLVYQWILVV